MSVASVQSAIRNLTIDGVLSEEDIPKVFEAAGDNVSANEMVEIRAAVFSQEGHLGYHIDDAAKDAAKDAALLANLSATEEVPQIEKGVTYGGTPIPPAVKELVANARLNGAQAYDVTERKNDGEGKWSPYPVTVAPKGSMAFNYTEVTPAKIEADKKDVDARYRVITGTEKEKFIDPMGRTREYTKVTYEWRTGGTGNISSHYDEAKRHGDIYARGRSGQKWASNFAILSDGSVHCLPASRRDPDQRLILTCPSLSRGKNMLYNGHLTMRDGVVTGVEMSGRLAKLAAKGKANFINPVDVLKAWGFEVADNVTIRFGNTRHGTPQVDADKNIITAQPSPDGE